MNLVEGGFYRARNGTIYGPLATANGFFQTAYSHLAWYLDGRALKRFASGGLDLIERVNVTPWGEPRSMADLFYDPRVELQQFRTECMMVHSTLQQTINALLARVAQLEARNSFLQMPPSTGYPGGGGGNT